MTPPDIIFLPPDGWVPNNPYIAVRVYRNVLHERGEILAGKLEALFASNGWQPDWRDTVWDYPHYHPGSHEALGVFAGSADLLIGGPKGKVIAVEAGDVVFLPAGTGHCRLTHSFDFRVVGAYPPGQSAFETCRAAPTDAQRRAIETTPMPPSTPVDGDWRS